VGTFGFASADGTRIRGWTNGGDGPAVLLCNGLGAPAVSWPLLAPADSGFHVVSWDYRGLGGSERPADPRRIAVADHVADALGALDAAGVERATLASWSIGVNVAFELAERYPDRVNALLAVAGVPGGTFRAMFGPLKGLPRARHAASVGVAKTLRTAGPVLSRVARTAPLTRTTASVARRAALMTPGAVPERLLPTLAEFRRHDFRWYFTLAVAMADHHPMDLAFVRCPATLVAGRRDILTSRHDMERAAARVPHAKLVVLDGSHFLPIERPEEITALLRELAS
jgi:pimeloyl-ACP methyl ester carboxylesterase